MIILIKNHTYSNNNKRLKLNKCFQTIFNHFNDQKQWNSIMEFETTNKSATKNIKHLYFITDYAKTTFIHCIFDK